MLNLVPFKTPFRDDSRDRDDWTNRYWASAVTLLLLFRLLLLLLLLLLRGRIRGRIQSPNLPPDDSGMTCNDFF
jgi:hypothetical protein